MLNKCITTGIGDLEPGLSELSNELKIIIRTSTLNFVSDANRPSQYKELIKYVFFSQKKRVANY